MHACRLATTALPCELTCQGAASTPAGFLQRGSRLHVGTPSAGMQDGSGSRQGRKRVRGVCGMLRHALLMECVMTCVCTLSNQNTATQARQLHACLLAQRSPSQCQHTTIQAAYRLGKVTHHCLVHVWGAPAACLACRTGIYVCLRINKEPSTCLSATHARQVMLQLHEQAIAEATCAKHTHLHVHRGTASSCGGLREGGGTRGGDTQPT